MRITQGMMTQQFLYNITQANQSMQQLETQLSTGKTLNRPSNNPLAVSQDMAIRASLSQTTGYQNSINAALSWMNNSQAAMQNLINGLQKIQQVVIQGINSTNSSSSDQALSQTAQNLIANLNQLVDSKQGNRYLFGGAATTGNGVPNPSSYADGTTAAPPGSSAAVSYEVAPGIQIAVNVTANQLFQVTPSTGTSNLQTTLQNVVADLSAGNTTGLQSDLSNLNAGLTHVTNANADLGARIMRVTVLQNQMSQYAQTITNAKGVIEDANMAQVVTQFNTDQTVYQSALKMGAQVLLPSLVNYLP